MKTKAFWKSGTISTGILSILLAAGSAYQSGTTWQGVALAVVGAAAIFFRSIAKTTVAWKFVVDVVNVIHEEVNKEDVFEEVDSSTAKTPIPGRSQEVTKKERRP
jgi:hypothetical protein